MTEIRTGSPTDYPMTEFFNGKEPEHRLGLPNYWVNTSNLNLIIEDRISFYKGLGPAIRFTLTYNSLSRERGQFGAGWNFSFESSLHEEGNMILLKKGSGQKLRFRGSLPPGSGSEKTPVEAENLSNNGDRLLDYGTHWLYLPKGARLSYRYMRITGKSILPLHSLSDFDGNIVTLEYSNDGAIRGITDAAGRVTRFDSSAGLCTGFVLPDGRRSSFQYDKGGHLIAVTDLQGIPVRYEYTTAGLVTLMEVGEDRKRLVFQYRDSLLSAITDAAGYTTRYQRDADSVKITDPLGNATTYVSKDGKTVTITNPLGESEFFEYEGGHRVGHNDGKGKGSRMTYDPAGNPVRYTSPNGEMTTFTYDQYGNLTAETTPLGSTFRFTFDSHQHLTGVGSPLGSEIRISYNQKGQLVSVADQNKSSTVFSYDSFGNTAEITDPEGHRTRFAFDPSGLTLQAVTDARGNTTKYEFDRNRRLTRIIHADGTSLKNVYGCCARLATIDENGKEMKITRDPLLSVIERRDGDGNSFRYRYDPCRRLIQSVDPRGQTTDFVYDGAGRLTGATYPTGEISRLEYAFGRTPGRIFDEKGNTISFVHDKNGAPIQQSDQTGVTASATRDLHGRISGIITGKGQRISFQYDVEDHLIGKDLDGKTVSSYRYDPAGNLVQMNDSAGATTYRYNRVGSITGITLSGNQEITCTYDEADNISSILYPDGILVKYQYDARNRPITVRFGSHEVEIRYDNVGNILAESRSNGTRSTYRSDARQRITEAVHLKGSDTVAAVSCIRDPAGNICEENGKQPFPEGIRQDSVTATYTPHNQVETWNGDRFRYDRDGNLTRIEGVRAFTAEYDAFNHLTSLQIEGEHRIFAYNGRGQRVQSTGNGGSRRYLYGPTGDLIAETDETGTVISCYIYCRGRLLAMVSNGRTYFYHADTCGHILCLTDEQGNISASYAYDTFGNAIEETGSLAHNQPFTYCGLYGVMREGGGLYFMKRRYYDAVTGRFIQKDPIGIIGGLNVYTYAGNNPVTYMDPEGLMGPFAVLALGGLALLAAGGAAVSLMNNEMWKTFLNRHGGTEKYILAPHAEGAYERQMANNRENPQPYVKNDYWEGLKNEWNAILTTSPIGWETSAGGFGLSNTYSAVKAANDTVNGDGFDAGRNAAEAVPGPFGQVWNAINNWYDAWKADQDNKCQ